MTTIEDLAAGEADALEDCETCSQGQSPLQRCAVCRRRVCNDCTNHPGDDAGPCVECEPPRPRPMEYAPMDNGTVHVGTFGTVRTAGFSPMPPCVAPGSAMAGAWPGIRAALDDAPRSPVVRVRPTMVFLPPTESAEDAERMAAAVRKLLGDAFDGGAKVGGA